MTPDAPTPPPSVPAPADGPRADGFAPVPGKTERFASVFSRKKSVRIGAGTTARKVWTAAYYLVTERDDGSFDVQALSPKWTPFGEKERVGKDKLLEEFLPEPEIYRKQVLPQMREVVKLTARGDRHRQRGETFSAEMEYTKALAIDEEHIKANFGIGLCYMERGEQEKAKEVFERVVKIEEAFEEEHKHLFNEFGINLRRSGMLDEAVSYYEKALVMAPDDENLHYNVARAAFAKNDLPSTVAHLKQCLALNRTHPQALKFVAYLKQQQKNAG